MFGCHVFNFLSLAAEDADFGAVGSVVEAAPKLWVRAFHDLPRRLWFVDAAVCGLVAAIMSSLVIGGIPYERLWDWGFKQPPKQDLMGAVMDRAKELDSRNGADSFEEAINDFAGKGDITGGRARQAEPAEAAHKVDCVILGYQLDRDGRLRRCCSAPRIAAKLIYAGRVSPEMAEGERSDLLAQTGGDSNATAIYFDRCRRCSMGAAEVHVPRQLAPSSEKTGELAAKS